MSSSAGVSIRWYPNRRYTATIDSRTWSRTATSAGSRSRIPLAGLLSIFMAPSREFIHQAHAMVRVPAQAVASIKCASITGQLDFGQAPDHSVEVMSVATRKVLVTGGTSGLGLAMATALAQAGGTVALTGRSGARAAAVAAELPGAVGLELDVCEESSVRRAIDQAWSRLGGIDMLVNNAGIGMRTVNPRFMTHRQGFWEVPPDGFRAVIETNLTGYFLVAREVTPRLLAAGGGRIVNIAVNRSTMDRAGFVPYGPSRAGSEALSKIMAADLAGTGVTVNLLLPGGATATGMVPPGERPAGPVLLDPAVMGPPIVWLASDEAAGVHGERIIATEFEHWLRDRKASQ